jgi:hypothetical protein
MSDRGRPRKLSGAVQSLLCALVVVPLAEAAAWTGLQAVAGERAVEVLAGVGMGAFCAVYAFGPFRWLADPDIAGRFGRDHPLAARVICLFGVLVGFGLAAAALVQW